MDELMVEMTRKITDQLEQFLKASKEKGNITFTDSLEMVTQAFICTQHLVEGKNP